MVGPEGLAMSPGPFVVRIGPGAYRVEHDGAGEIVYVAGPVGDLWAFSKGTVFRGALTGAEERRPNPRTATPQSVLAPMPATVTEVLVRPGMAVKKGQTVVLLDAMKMEVPVRAPSDAVVAAVHCRAGQLVQGEAPLVDFQ
jgi:biotin carboxyl carrier protein